VLAEQLDQEAVGMTGPDSVRVSSLVRKVFQVEGHDRVGTAADCRGENVPVLGITPQLIDEIIEAVDQRFRAKASRIMATRRPACSGATPTFGRFLCTSSRIGSDHSG